MNTLDFILHKFNIEYKGCVCRHLPSEHVHEVKACTECNCERYGRNVPLEIPNFGREQLSGLLRELGLNKGAEIGVMRGEYAEILCKHHPELHLYCVDSWAEYPSYRLGDQKTMNVYHAEALKRLEAYNCTFIRKFSIDAAQDFADGSLGFIYLDANHTFEHVVNDLSAWIPKVRKDGIVAGHDYIKRGMGPKVFGKANTSFHVQEAVDAYTLAYHIDPFFVLGRKAFVEGEIRDKIRSFLWVKEE